MLSMVELNNQQTMKYNKEKLGMSDGTPNISTPEIEGLRTHALIAYALMVLGILSGGIFSLMGLIWAYIKRGDAAGSIYHSHFQNIISTFWISVVLSIVGVLLWFFGIGVFIFIFVAIFNIYRIAKGLIKTIDRKEFV